MTYLQHGQPLSLDGPAVNHARASRQLKFEYWIQSRRQSSNVASCYRSATASFASDIQTNSFSDDKGAVALLCLTFILQCCAKAPRGWVARNPSLCIWLGFSSLATLQTSMYFTSLSYVTFVFVMCHVHTSFLSDSCRPAISMRSQPGAHETPHLG